MNIPTDQARQESPAPAISALVNAELAPTPKLVYVVLLTLDLVSVGIIGMLLLTEPATLPMATRLAFAAMLALGLVWAGFFAWVIARKRVLFAGHRVTAGWIALAGTVLFAVASLAIALGRTGSLGIATVIATGLTLLVIAIVNLRNATRRHRSLLDRRDELRRQIAEQ